ncbi:heat shock factor 2-binding protein isoform X2 [Ranitomeya variabilis]|uniref:heat shock factor 2-binding protein isoform X2 n=1 Tax=Ranitomeya variabilis TaxID=490064 RepID=UPI0040567220
MSGPLEGEFVFVRRRDLERLTTEVMQMKEFLPKILSQDVLEGVQRLEVVESALEERELDYEHIKARLQATQTECLRTKEDKSAEFFSLAGQTVSSFVESLAVKPDEDTEESRFVLGLAGTITNVAAVSCGRDFLMSSCREVMEKWIQLLGKIGSGCCGRLRVLILMSLYNVSIHREGLVWMSRNLGLVPQLQQLLTDPDNEVCLHALRLIQSLVLEPDVLHMLWEDVHQCLPLITELSHASNSELQKMAVELLEELRGLIVEG